MNKNNVDQYANEANKQTTRLENGGGFRLQHTIQLITCDSNRVVLNAAAHIVTMTCTHFVKSEQEKLCNLILKLYFFLLDCHKHRLNVDGFNYWHDDG
jgi:hypothetical protein